MKKLQKIRLNDAAFLSDAEMKKVIGGSYGENGAVSCTVSLSCANGSISCSSSTGDCSSIWENDLRVGIKCEGTTYRCK